MRTVSRRYRPIVLIVTLLTVTWLAAPAVAAVPNTPPVAVDDVYDVDEDGTLTVDAPGILRNDTDADGDPLMLDRHGNGPASGVLSITSLDGAFQYEPDPDFSGVDTFQYTIHDGVDISNIATVTITVHPVNDPPVAEPDAYTVNEDDLLATPAPGVLGNDSDVEGDPLSAVLDSGPSFGTLFALNADGSFRYEPDANYYGPDRFSYHANDGDADSAVAIVSITVDPVNDRPVAVADAYEVAEDGTLAIAAPGLLRNDRDIEDDPLTAIKRSDPSHGTLTAFGGDGSFTYEPAADYNGPDSFRYRVTDGVLNSNTVVVDIAVGAVNDAPVGVPDRYEVLEDEILTIRAPGVLGNDTDVEGDTLTAHLDIAASEGDLTTFRRNGSFVYEPDANFHGTDFFGYHASDGTDDSEVTRVTIVVVSVNDAPVAFADRYEVLENARLVVGAPGILDNDTDADGDRLRAILDSDPANGELTAFARNGAFTYVPDADFAGTDSFTYHATDTVDNSEIVTVTIVVIADNEAPVAVADSYEVGKNGELVLPAPGVLGNDSDANGDTLAAILDTAPIHGSLTLNADGSFTYSPDRGYVGVDGFRYHANDGSEDSNIVRAVIDVKQACNGVIATIVGTNGADVINGTAGADVIAGLKGNDTIHGLEGDDLICGGGGADTIFGDSGHDHIFGGGRSDVILGGEGNDRLEGWAGDDRLFGGLGNDRLEGEGGNDLLKGNSGEDLLIGGKGADRMFGNRGDDRIFARDGFIDKINGGFGFDRAAVDEDLDIWRSVEKLFF